MKFDVHTNKVVQLCNSNQANDVATMGSLRSYLKVQELHKFLEVHDDLPNVLEPASPVYFNHIVNQVLRLSSALVNVAIDVPEQEKKSCELKHIKCQHTLSYRLQNYDSYDATTT